MPGDTKPHLARAAKKRARRPKPGTAKQLTAVLWRAITHLEAHLEATAGAETVDTAELCKLTHATAQAAGTYLKALEVGELEARLEAVEKAQEADHSVNGSSRAPSGADRARPPEPEGRPLPGGRWEDPPAPRQPPPAALPLERTLT